MNGTIAQHPNKQLFPSGSLTSACLLPAACHPLQVLFVTADPDAYSLQPENAIKVRADTNVLLYVCIQPAAPHASFWIVHGKGECPTGAGLPTSFWRAPPAQRLCTLSPPPPLPCNMGAAEEGVEGG